RLRRRAGRARPELGSLSRWLLEKGGNYARRMPRYLPHRRVSARQERHRPGHSCRACRRANSYLHNDSNYFKLPPMQRTNFAHLQCPIARSLERVGEWWSILILRDAVYGVKRFDEFQRSLDIAPNMLTRRLNALVKSGLLKRQRYSDKPPRFEYVLTERGRDFRPVMLALLAWGNKHFAPEGASVLLA